MNCMILSYDCIIALKKCSDALVSTSKRRAKDVIVPGWNEQVKELHVEARHAYLTWRDVGKPRQGDVFTTMKLSRSKFKYALRKCKRDKETVIADNIAEKLCQKDSRDFWKNIKQMTNKKSSFQQILMVFMAIMISSQCGNSNTQPYLIVLKTVAVIKLTVISLTPTSPLTMV